MIIDNGKNLNLDSLDDKIYKKNIQIIKNENFGNGQAINIASKLLNTKYLLYLDVDTRINLNDIKKLLNIAESNDNAAVVAPSLKNIKYSEIDIINKDKKIYEMKFVEGAILLINKKNTFEKGICFDENIFLYYEENDFYYQCIKSGKKIFLALEITAEHISNSSIDKTQINTKEIEYNRNWHYMWSKFYFYKKNFGYFFAVYKTIKSLISSYIKFLMFYFINNDRSKIYKNRFSGLVNSYLLKKSWKRPNL